jgi:hypothetical protein
MRTTRQRGREAPSGLWIGPIPEIMEPVDSAVVRLSLNFSPFLRRLQVAGGPKEKSLKIFEIARDTRCPYPQFSFSEPRTIRFGRLLNMLC